ncbi:HPP family protein [Sphingomonas sp. AOB5]|uniref:HPP family protein n=1 Tax=Sphingomonas sp. AOB5 TaxID=3034017 RepID=UPI0023F85DB4|nr:HPP family protein [Sphingomonas sp. AOB5]MDF7777099.1 HPP family protein [Sphingomonas sp. AOB5]
MRWGEQFRLAGANWRDRLIAALGAFFGIALTGFICSYVAGDAQSAILLAAPIGASAVLVFAIPSSPLAQPMAVILGNIVSASCGILSVRLFGHGALAAGVAVSLAIVGMTALRCLHAPGGGSALVPVVAGPEVAAHGFALALVPFGLNALLLVMIGFLFHRLSGHSYPHRAAPAPAAAAMTAADIDAALVEMGESFDVSREDLEALLASAERHAQARRRG